VFRPDKDKPVPIDLGADNRLAQVLKERENVRKLLDISKKNIKAYDAEIIEKLNGAETAIAGDWKISHKTTHVPEAVRKAYDYTPLLVTPPKEEKTP
jgi:hypothetical protein